VNRNHERQQVEMDRRHLAHKKSQLTELKDQLLTRQMSYKAYQPAAYGLTREIHALEEKLRIEPENSLHGTVSRRRNKMSDRCHNDHTERAKMVPLFYGDTFAGWYCPVCLKEVGEKEQERLTKSYQAVQSSTPAGGAS